MASLHSDLFRAIDVGLAVWQVSDPYDDRTVSLLEANPAAARLLQSPALCAAGTGMTIDELVPDARSVGLPGLIARAARLRIPGQVDELSWTGASGTEVILAGAIHPLDDGAIALVMVDGAERRDDRQRLVHQARHDTLTGLANREHFRERIALCIEKAAGEGGSVAVALLDLDRFKEVNDTLGHQQGDQLLRQVGHRLSRLLGDVDLIARLGGDEFGIVTGPVNQSPTTLAARVASAFALPFDLGNLAVRSQTSVGVAMFPQHGLTADELLQRADIAMYAAKRTGRGAAVYRPEDDPYNLRRLTLMSELRDAILNGELALHFQPKVDLARHEVVGAEALVRWNHPTMGELAPGEFVPMAEETGLIGPLTSWVLTETGRQCRAWYDAGIDLNLSANISARNLYDPGLVRLLRRILDGHDGAPAGRITLELTETQVAEDLPMARTILRRLQAMGARLSIDDFGTGYSSLSYLSKLPLDELKIDRSFVGDLGSGNGDTIVQSIIGLGHDLGLHVVAEGVESTAAWSSLEALGCDVVQGHQVSQALSVEAFEAWLADCPYAVAHPA